MPSYIDGKGEKIEVTDGHVEVAIEIKKELQKESPSGRCSWIRHKRMMVEEGFEDSSTNENYRCMIKAEQKKRGELPSAEKHAERVSESKLESIRNAIGEMYIAKRSNQNTLRELNKAKREISDNFILFEDIKKEILQIDMVDVVQSKLSPLEKTKNALLVNVSDWHIGLVTEEFNYKVANERILKYAQRVIEYAELFEVNTLYVQNLGDSIEGVSMRYTQPFDIEFDYSTQVVKATELTIKFLTELSEYCNVVYLGGIYGNHSRFTDKDKSLAGDSSENIIDASVKSFIELMNNPRITADDKKQNNSEMSFEINGKYIKAVHGDLIGKQGDRITKFISSDKIDYDLLVYGHYHNFSVSEQNHGKLEVGSGCLQGSTEYSKRLGYETEASQLLILFKGEDILPIKVKLE